ncbi:MAG: metal-dependent hydrolase [Planctomycetaceae bacterium]|nr:metal-dependent hydrolase [Planctomycetaceae bacterium]
MRLIFLGTGGYHPNERRQTASLLLPEQGIALDAGTGMFRLASKLACSELDVLLTHAHLDHIVGLTFLLVPMLKGELTRVRVYGTEETLRAVRDHLFAPALFPVMPDFEWCPLTKSPMSFANGVSVCWTGLDHPGGSIAYRIEAGGKSVAYVTDTTAPGRYGDFIHGVDLLVHECYFPDDMADWAAKTGHSNSTPVAQIARSAAVKRLVLVHADPQHPEDDPIGLDGIRKIFPNSQLAEDLGEIEI